MFAEPEGQAPNRREAQAVERPHPIPPPETKLPAYESLPEMLRRVVREELGPVLDGIEEVQAMLAASSAQDTSAVEGA
jgi:hypothetical protein